MDSLRRVQPDIAYLRSLIGAGLTGISAARREVGGQVFTPSLRTAAWTPAAIGATIGALGSGMTGSRKASRIAIGGLLGTLLGFGAALAWTSRRFTGCAARRATHLVNATRDAHWLEGHPIDYA